MGRKSRRASGGKQTTLITESIEPNDNITVPIGPLKLTRLMFEEFGLDPLLTGLKRDQGASVTDVTAALVAHAMQMDGLSINRMEDVIEDRRKRYIYGLDDDVDKNDLYRVTNRLGRNIDTIINHLDTVLTERFCIDIRQAYIDWSATYVDGVTSDLVRYGHSKDHRPDRPQVNIGMAMESAHNLLCGLTVMPGNTNDTVHLKESFRQVRPFLSPKCLIVFDAGAYSDENAKMITGEGFDFLTRLKLNTSDEAHIKVEPGLWLRLDDDVRALMYRGNNRRVKVLYFSQKRHDDLLEGYRRKAERDYDEAIGLKAMVKKGKPRKKYVNSNSFLKTSVGYQFPLDMTDREGCIEWAVKERITGREGYFVLTSNRVMLPSEMLRIYRSRNDIEDAYRDLKNGIDIRPVRCRDEDAVRGRVLIAYLALFAIGFARFVAPEVATKQADTIIGELISFSLTVESSEKGEQRLIYSNFNPTIRAIMGGFDSIPTLIRTMKEGRTTRFHPSENGDRSQDSIGVSADAPSRAYTRSRAYRCERGISDKLRF